MSSIHDSLNNAGQVRSKDDAPAAESAQSPAECPAAPRRQSNLPLTALIAAVMLLSGYMMVEWFRADSGELKVRARSYDSAVKPVSAPQPGSHPAPIPARLEDAKPAATVSANAVAAEKPAAVSAPTEVPATVEPPKPAPVTYKLQGILYLPGHSSAVINGKTVYAGERVADSRVVSIDKETVVLVNNAGQTNLLELP
jgi:hypothetical protein